MWPGRLIFPGGPLAQFTQKHLDTLESCNDYDFSEFCRDAEKNVDPPEPSAEGEP
jgi:hypothetical protein